MGKDGAIALSRRGHQVLATTHTQTEAEALRKELNEIDVDIPVTKIDIRQPSDRRKALDFEPDVLINNAAIGESGPIAEIPMDRVRDNFETNVFGTLALTQPIARQMAQRKSGRIIVFSSVGGKITLPYLGAYNMTKYALESMSDALRQELAPYGVKVSVIEPGAIGTGFNERMNESKYTWFNEKSFFADDAELMKKYEQMLVRNQAPTDGITSAVVHAVESARPKTRYIRPRAIGIQVWLAQLVPDRIRDWMIRRNI